MCLGYEHKHCFMLIALVDWFVIYKTDCKHFIHMQSSKCMAAIITPWPYSVFLLAKKMHGTLQHYYEQ